jgi:hypothetical protein
VVGGLRARAAPAARAGPRRATRGGRLLCLLQLLARRLPLSLFTLLCTSRLWGCATLHNNCRRQWAGREAARVDRTRRASQPLQHTPAVNTATRHTSCRQLRRPQCTAPHLSSRSCGRKQAWLPSALARAPWRGAAQHPGAAWSCRQAGKSRAAGCGIRVCRPFMCLGV